MRRSNLPVIPFLHSLLYRERENRLALWDRFKGFIYYEPLFKTQCASCGKGLYLIGGMPQIYGDLRLHVGTNVTLHGAATFTAGKVFPDPTLTIGNDTHLGYQVGIMVGTRVTIGSHVLIANRVALVGYDLHPTDPVRRARGEPPDESGCGDITIEDHAWIGMNSTILKGVTVGRAAIVGSGSMVTKDVPPMTIVAGNPARVVKELVEESPETA